jgi:hypothetical protein
MALRVSRLAFAGVLLAGLLFGCSSGSGKIPITGSVSVDGAPGSLTVLTFWPEDPSAPPDAGGRVLADDQGQFAIGDKTKDTGLLKGTYKVTFSRFLDRNGKPVLGGGKKSEAAYDVPSRESIPELYGDPKKTPISVTVASGSSTFTFEVSTKTK